MIFSLLYGVFLALFIFILSRILVDIIESAHPAPCTGSPIIQRSNASKAIMRRFQDVKLTFEHAMHTPGWRVLRSRHNVSIEIIEAKEGWPMFIRTTTFFDASPVEVADSFAWSNFDRIQRLVDPFYETSQLLLEPTTQMKLIRKVKLAIEL